MILIDELVHWDDENCEAIKLFHDGDFGTSEGYISESILIECLAQTVAAMQGAILHEQGRRQTTGMLVGVNDFKFFATARTSIPLKMNMKVTRRLGPFSLTDGTVYQDGKRIAAGTLKFYLPEQTNEI